MTRALTAIALAAALAPSAWGAAASVYYPIPQNFASASRQANGVVSATAWNINGTRCVWPSGKGWSNLGFNVSTGAFVPNGAAAPVLTLYADGVARARVAGNNLGSDGVYTAYSAALVTKCVGGVNAGQPCNADSACAPSNGVGAAGTCVACDQNNTCNTSGVLGAPCVVNTCVGGTNAGEACNVNADCNSNNCSAVGLPSGLTTCFLMQKCNAAYTQCDNTGVKDNGSGNGGFHSALAIVRTGVGLLGSSEKLVNYVSGSGTSNPFANCGTNCDGGIDQMSGTLPAVVCEH